jgi:hypothetical protein
MRAYASLVAWFALVVLACLFAGARDSAACGLFVAPASESQLAASLPYLAVERVLLVWDEDSQTEDFVREARFERADRRFGFVVPVPTRPEVFAVTRQPFDDLARVFPYSPAPAPQSGAGGGRGEGIGGGAAPTVLVLSEQRIGSFTAFVLSATDGDGLGAWLKDNGLRAPPEAQDWLAHYVRLGFYYVAFRYEAPAAATTGMTSETVRIRFRTPAPYYPYLEPARSDVPVGRGLLLWFVSQQEAEPIAWHRSRASDEPGAGEPLVAWRRPWNPGASRLVSGAEVRAAIPSLEGLVPGDDDRTPKWHVQPYRDMKPSRLGYGDVVLVPKQPLPATDEAIAARWPLLSLLDPTLEGRLDDPPWKAAAFESPAPATSATPGEGGKRPGAAPPMQRSGPASTGCSVTPPVAASSPGAPLGTLVVAAALALVRRRRGTLAAAGLAGALSSCRPDARSAGQGAMPAIEPTPALSMPVPSAIAFTPDGAGLLVGLGSTLSVYDVATGRELRKMDLAPAVSSAGFGVGGAPPVIRSVYPAVARQALVGLRPLTGGDGTVVLVDLDGPRVVWSDLNSGPGEHRMAVSDDGRLAIVEGDGKWSLRDLTQNRLVRRWDSIGAGAFAFAGADRAVGGEPLTVWDTKHEGRGEAISPPTESHMRVAATSDGARAVTLSSDTLRVFDLRAGREVRSFDLYGYGSALDLAISRDGRRAYTHQTSTACAWDLDAGVRIGCREGFAPAWSQGQLALAPSGRVLAVVTGEGVSFFEVEGAFGGDASRPSAAVAPWPTAPAAPPGLAGEPFRLVLSGERAERERASLALLFGRTNLQRLVPDGDELSKREVRVDVRHVAATGTAAPDDVARIIRQNRGRLRLCYARGLRDDPSLSGRLRTTLTIDAQGEVAKSKLEQTTLRDERVVVCVLHALGQLSFSPPASAATVDLTLGFTAED